MEDLHVVKMQLEHLEDVMIIENLSFSIPWSRNSFVEEITSNQFARYITAKQDGRIIGYAGMWKICDEGHITNIAVHTDFREKGVGSLLMENLIQVAIDENILRMTLEVRKSNLAAQALYSKFGFTEAGLRKRYYADNGEDAIIMWKESIED